MDWVEVASHPLALALLQWSLLVFFVGFTPGHSFLRLSVGLPLTLIVLYYILTTSLQKITYNTVAISLMGNSCGQLNQYIDVALVGKWDIKAGGPLRNIWRDKDTLSTNRYIVPRRATAAKSQASRGTNGQVRRGTFSITERIKFGLRAFGDERGSNTEWESKGVPPFSNSDPTWVPGRKWFLVTTFLKFATCYLFLDIVTAQPMENAAEMFAWEKIALFSRWSEVTIDELTIRAVTSLVGLLCSQAMVGGLYHLLAFASVFLGLANPKDWRPFMNYPSEGYTVRRFWSPMFHQLGRRQWSSQATVVTYDFLRLQRGSLAAKYTHMFCVFAASGIVHGVAPAIKATSWQGSYGTMLYFLAQFAVIVFEDFVGWVTGLRGCRPSWWLKSLGFVWVLCFESIMFPYWHYPTISSVSGGDEDAVVPFSVVKALAAW